MSTDSCERCGSPAPEALLRNVSLHVDGSEVDTQTICPDCFADWIAHYQGQMAGDMPSPTDSAAEGLDSGDASEESTESNPLSETVQVAQEEAGPNEQADSGGTVADEATKATPPEMQESTVDTTGGEIREVGTTDSAATDNGVEVDLGAETDGEEDDDDDDGGLILG